MNREKLINFLNFYFKKFGNKNLENDWSIDHSVDIFVYDIFRDRETKKIKIFLDSDPEKLEHTIEDEDYEPVHFHDALFMELLKALQLVNINLGDFILYVNQRSLEDDLPFDEDQISENVKIRTFHKNTKTDELKWHRDREDRIVEVLENNSWQLQMDNEIPKTLIKGKKYYIPEGKYHRVIKGDGNLKVKITLR